MPDRPFRFGSFREKSGIGRRFAPPSPTLDPTVWTRRPDRLVPVAGGHGHNPAAAFCALAGGVCVRRDSTLGHPRGTSHQVIRLRHQPCHSNVHKDIVPSGLLLGVIAVTGGLLLAVNALGNKPLEHFKVLRQRAIHQLIGRL